MLKYGYESNKGLIVRLYPEADKVYFSLGGPAVKKEMKPKDDYYYISRLHPNYEALVDLLYLAAEHQWTLKVRTEENLDPNGHAKVVYLVQDF